MVRPQLRLTVRRLTIAALITGLTGGVLARRWSTGLRRQTMIVQLRLQKQVTRAALFEERGDIAGLGSDTSEFENDEPFGFNAWTLEFEAWDEALGRRKRRFRAKVSGGCDDFHLTPIAIRISGSASDGPRLRRLTCAYAAHGWDYEIGSL